MSAFFPTTAWQPAPVRTIKVGTPTNLRVQSLIPLNAQISWAPKSAADHLDFCLDPSDWLAQTNDIIAFIPQPVVTSASGLITDLTPLWWGPINNCAVIFMGGGAPGTTQSVNVTIQTVQGRVLTISVQIAINLVSNAVIPTPSGTTPSGIGVPPNALSCDGVSVLSIDGVRPLVIA